MAHALDLQETRVSEDILKCVISEKKLWSRYSEKKCIGHSYNQSMFQYLCTWPLAPQFFHLPYTYSLLYDFSDSPTKRQSIFSFLVSGGPQISLGSTEQHRIDDMPVLILGFESLPILQFSFQDPCHQLIKNMPGLKS